MKQVSQREAMEARKMLLDLRQKDEQVAQEIIAAEKKSPRERTELEKRLVGIPCIIGSGYLFQTVEMIKRELSINTNSR